jgi:hypothetical protein
MKSPIMSISEVKTDFERCKKLFEVWAENTNGQSSGLHVHVSMDDVFSVNKKPASKTYIFLTKLVQVFESKLFTTAESRQKHFKRDFNNSYAYSVLNSDDISDSRYYWVNLTNLNRYVGKTVEFRLGSAGLASELPVYIEKVYLLSTLIKLALRHWRNSGRISFEEWTSSFGERGILKTLLSKEMLVRFWELFLKSNKHNQAA